MIRYLDFALCDKQHTMCKEMMSILGEIRSQSELQANKHSLSDTMTSLVEYAKNPTKQDVFQTTVEALDEAVTATQEDQKTFFIKQLQLRKKFLLFTKTKSSVHQPSTACHCTHFS